MPTEIENKYLLAALRVILERAAGRDLLRLMQLAQPGMSESTYRRRFRVAKARLADIDAIVKRPDAHDEEWIVTAKGFEILEPQHIAQAFFRLLGDLDSSDKELDQAYDDAAETDEELENLRDALLMANEQLSQHQQTNENSIESRIGATFSGLQLSEHLIEAIVLLSIMESMLRHRIAESNSGTRAENQNFTQLIATVRRILKDEDGIVLEFRDEWRKTLYGFRSRIIHDGLQQNVRDAEVKAIRELVRDLYEQIYSPQ